MNPHIPVFIKKLRKHPLAGVALFMAITIVFHVLWRLGRPWFEEASWYLALADFTTQQAYLAAAWINDLLIGDAITRLDQVCTFRLEGARAGEGIFTGHLIIDHTCSGLKQFYQALVLFLVYPGPWKHKLWYIPAAILVMHVTNILRIVALSFTMLYTYQHWDFVHDWVVRPGFYVVLFGLWVLWEEKFRRKDAK